MNTETLAYSARVAREVVTERDIMAAWARRGCDGPGGESELLSFAYQCIALAVAPIEARVMADASAKPALLPKQPNHWQRHYCEPCCKWFSLIGLQVHKCVDDEAELPSTSTQDRPDARDEGDFDGK